jgi:hypothetical protein
MKRKKKNKILTAIVVLMTTFFVIDVCKNWHGYDAFPIRQAELPALEKKEILLTTKALNGEESKAFLGKDLIDRGYQPIQLTIQNNSPRSYILAQDKIELPTASASDVAWRVTKGTIPRGIAYKIASFFFWPFIIPSTIDSINTLKSHGDLKRDLHAKTVSHEEITPYSTVTRVIFVPKDEYRSSFQVTLVDAETGKHLVFDALT